MPLTLPQLERHLFKAADILRGKMDASEFKEHRGPARSRDRKDKRDAAARALQGFLRILGYR